MKKQPKRCVCEGRKTCINWWWCRCSCHASGAPRRLPINKHTK